MKTICLTLLLFFLDSISWAVRVDSCVGSFRDDTVLVRGSGFGTKIPAAPVIWADFENIDLRPTFLGQKAVWDDVQNLTLSSDNNRAGSLLCAQGTWATGKNSFSFRVDKRFWTRIYHYQKRYYTFSATGNQKFWRLWPTTGPNNFIAAYLNGGAVAYNEIDTSNPDRFQGNVYQSGRWLTEEFHWEHGGLWEYSRDGVVVQRMENVNNGPNTLEQLRTDNFTDSTHLPPAGASVYMDDIYIDDTLARVVLADKPTMAQSTLREIQIPLSWAEESIVIKPRADAWQNGQTAYLYVFDPDGSVNLPGFPVILGSDTLGPLNPFGLKVH